LKDHIYLYFPKYAYLLFNKFPTTLYTMAKSMKDNKAIRMLKAAEEGGYGVIGVVSVNPIPLIFHNLVLRKIRSITSKP
jgi:hypothetical protein